MTPEEFTQMQATGVAPCGCRVTFGRDLSGAEQRSCLHGDACADKVAAAEAAAKAEKQAAKQEKAAADKKEAAKAEKAAAAKVEEDKAAAHSEWTRSEPTWSGTR